MIMKPASQGEETVGVQNASLAVNDNRTTSISTTNCAWATGPEGSLAWWEVDMEMDYVIESVRIFFKEIRL